MSTDSATLQSSTIFDRVQPHIKAWSLYGALFVVGAVLTFLAPHVFLTIPNLLTVVKQTAIIGILAIGTTVVIISGGIDLSLGSLVALSGVCTAFLAQDSAGHGVMLPLLAALLVGTAVGTFNGIGIVWGRLPPFIMTLATMSIARGLSYLLTNGRPVSNFTSSFEWIGRGTVAGVYNLVIIFAIVAVLIGLLLRFTRFGRHVYAVGNNEAAAKYSGVRIVQTKMLVYALSGLLAGLAGALLVARTTVGSPNAGLSFELDAIAASIIGGTSLSGGRGSIVKTVIGALLINIIGNGLDILGLSTFIQQIVKGAIVIFAVLVDIRSK